MHVLHGAGVYRALSLALWEWVRTQTYRLEGGAAELDRASLDAIFFAHGTSAAELGLNLELEDHELVPALRIVHANVEMALDRIAAI